MEIMAAFPQLNFVPSGYFAFNAADEVIYFDQERLGSSIGRLSLLHEISHCLLGHFEYDYDLQLLCMERDAWAKTRELAPNFNLNIDEAYVSDCVQTYDKWLTERATCPRCSNFCLQASENQFNCFCCDASWRVSSSASEKNVRKIMIS